jgi:hypothetical protein
MGAHAYKLSYREAETGGLQFEASPGKNVNKIPS